jgi:hypothetical protein
LDGRETVPQIMDAITAGSAYGPRSYVERWVAPVGNTR